MGNVYSQNAVAKYLENSSILKARLKVVFNFLFVLNSFLEVNETENEHQTLEEKKFKPTLQKMFKSTSCICIISQLWKIEKRNSIKALILCTSDFLLARSYMYILLAGT